MSDLFDLPFEEDEADALAAKAAPAPPSAPAGPRDQAEDAGLPIRRRILTVTELTVRLRDLVESEFGEVWVEGEISNCRLWNTGHLYCTLKDKSSQLNLVIFRTALRYLPFKPQDGLKVVARGRISVYEPKGEYQLVCEHMEPQGLGARQLAFEQLKAKLQAEGLFDADRKRRLPALPRKIGIVTSLDGAAVRDIIKVLRRRYANAHLVVAPARVQGDGATIEIARALRQIGRVVGVDVVIVGRGGGSIEDLWAFNDETVARAIAKSQVPVISAVGHETDYTIADFVADLRAPTPSAAAELVVAAKNEFVSRIDRLADRLSASARRGLDDRRRRVHFVETRPAFAGFHGRLAMRGRDVADLGNAASRGIDASVDARRRMLRDMERRLGIFDPARRLAALGGRLTAATSRLTGAATARRQRALREFQVAAGRLETLNPLAVLARGYAVCWTAERNLVRAATDVRPGDTVHVTLSRGAIEAKVSKTT
jgi:exodeoxyribonuclease VII large subunit